MKKILYLFLTVSLIFSSCTKENNDVLGCTDATAFNYDASADTDDGTCIAVAFGCIDETAENYNNLANTDDGTCTYSIKGSWDMIAATVGNINLFDTSLEPHLVSGVWDITANGSYSQNMLNSFNYTDIITGTWSLNGDVFSMTGGDSSDGITNLTVETLDANNLTLSGQVETTDDVFETATFTFTR